MIQLPNDFLHCLLDMFLTAQVPRRYGPITVTSPSPSGSFLAVGTAQGGLLVWDLRNDEPSPPWFEVSVQASQGLGFNVPLAKPW